MLDGNFVSALADELDRALAGGRIDRVQQPSKEILILNVRSRGKCERLLMSVSPSFARIHITESDYECLPEPPMFCMLLRKHVTGAVIEKIEQMNGDRIVCLSLSYSDEYGRAYKERLYLEMIPGRINIILVDAEGMIIDCIHRREYEPDMYRRVFPGMVYHLPRKSENFVQNVKSSDGTVLSNEFPTLSSFLDAYYSERERQELYRRRTKELRASLNSARKRIEKKLANQRIELEKSRGREESKRRADLITANMYRIEKGDSEFVCEDFYQEGSPEVRIRIDPLKSPQQNAAKLYREYSKLKTAEEYLTGLIDRAQQQLEYIDSAMDELSRADSNADIEGIREELSLSGIIRARAGKNSSGKDKKRRSPALPFIKYETPDGLDVLVGRNNLQNDELTFRIARKSDLWFHVRNFHGSHVILRTLGSAPTEKDIAFAAEIAVRHSQASGGASVDYTEIRHVRKPSGSLPGKVVYTDQRTLAVRSAD